VILDKIAVVFTSINWFNSSQSRLIFEAIIIFRRLSCMTEKKLVLKAMVKIAKSDGSYHMIIKKAAKYWNINLSDLDL